MDETRDTVSLLVAVRNGVAEYYHCSDVEVHLIVTSLDSIKMKVVVTPEIELNYESVCDACIKVARMLGDKARRLDNYRHSFE